MAVLTLTRFRIAAFIVCAIIPTSILFQLEAFNLNLSPHSFSFPSFKWGSEPALEVLPEPIVQSITNNNATYPRISFDLAGSEYVAQAKIQLARLETIQETLFGGSDMNKLQMEMLFSYLRGAETEEEYVPPRVVLTSWHWVPCAYGSCSGGEAQWMQIMKEHNIIYLFSPWQRFQKDFKLLGNDLVTHAWVDDEHAVWCFADPARCLQTEENPEGIPSWKLFAFTFWGSQPNADKWNSLSEPWSFNPLGAEWNLVPYQMPEKHFFLGYHFQGCHSLKYIPFEEREKRIVVLAKRSNYFHNFPAFDPKTFYAHLQNHTGYEVVSNAVDEDGYPIPEGLHSLGLMPQDEYNHLLANAKALLGIGRPTISPTPYASLCRGVPVILPYNGHFVLSHNNKTCGPRPGPSDWCGFLGFIHQHGPASAIGPPYVYSVDTHSTAEEILKVIDTAINTPIEPYEPPEMRPAAVEARLLDYFAIDWERYAEERMRDRGLDKLSLPDFLQRWAKSHPDSSLES